MKNYKLLSVALLAIGVAALARTQVVLYDNLGTPAVTGYGDTDGGQNDFSTGYGAQTGQLFTDSSANTVTEVVSLYLGASAASSGATGLLIQVFNVSGGVVGSEVGQQTVSNYFETDNTNVATGLPEWGITVAGLNIGGLVSGNQYLLTMQIQGPNYGWQESDASGAAGTYIRNYSSFGNPGVSGWPGSWTEVGAAGLGYNSGNCEMMIMGATQAVPTPAGILALGLGIGALLIRKRMS